MLEDINVKKSIKFSNEKANILQKQFCNGDIPKLSRRTDISIYDLFIAKKIVEEDIKDMNINKPCGPDQLHPWMLKELNIIMSRSIALLPNKSRPRCCDHCVETSVCLIYL